MTLIPLGGEVVVTTETKDAAGNVMASNVQSFQCEEVVQPPIEPEPPHVPPVPPVVLAFASDWGTGLGTSENALTDGGVWDGASGRPNVLEVVAAVGLDFPSANVLRVEQLEGARFRNVNVAGAWSLPAIGSSIWKRIYWRNNTSTSGQGGFNHPVQSCAFGGSKCGDLWWRHNFPGGSTWHLQLTTNDTPYPENHHSPGSVFSYNVTYRLEWQMKRLTATTWELHARIYDSRDVLLYDDGDFVNSEGNGSLLDLPTIITNDPRSQTECLIGWQGGRGVIGGGEYIYFGAYAVSLTDWCGAY